MEPCFPFINFSYLGLLFVLSTMESPNREKNSKIWIYEDVSPSTAKTARLNGQMWSKVSVFPPFL